MSSTEQPNYTDTFTRISGPLALWRTVEPAIDRDDSTRIVRPSQTTIQLVVAAEESLRGAALLPAYSNTVGYAFSVLGHACGEHLRREEARKDRAALLELANALKLISGSLGAESPDAPLCGRCGGPLDRFDCIECAGKGCDECDRGKVLECNNLERPEPASHPAQGAKHARDTGHALAELQADFGFPALRAFLVCADALEPLPAEAREAVLRAVSALLDVEIGGAL